MVLWQWTWVWLGAKQDDLLWSRLLFEGRVAHMTRRKQKKKWNKVMQYKTQVSPKLMRIFLYFPYLKIYIYIQKVSCLLFFLWSPTVNSPFIRKQMKLRCTNLSESNSPSSQLVPTSLLEPPAPWTINKKKKQKNNFFFCWGFNRIGKYFWWAMC